MSSGINNQPEWIDISNYNLALWFHVGAASFMLVSIDPSKPVKLTQDQVRSLNALGFSKKNNVYIAPNKTMSQKSILSIFPHGCKRQVKEMLVKPIWNEKNTSIMNGYYPQFAWFLKDGSDIRLPFKNQANKVISLMFNERCALVPVSSEEIMSYPPLSPLDEKKDLWLIDVATKENPGRFTWLDLSAHGVRMKWYIHEKNGLRDYFMTALTKNPDSVRKLESLGFSLSKNLSHTWSAKGAGLSLGAIQDVFQEAREVEGKPSDLFFSFMNPKLIAGTDYDKIRLSLFKKFQNEVDSNESRDAGLRTDDPSSGGGGQHESSGGDASRSEGGGAGGGEREPDGSIPQSSGNAELDDTKNTNNSIGFNKSRIRERAENNIEAIKRLKFLQLSPIKEVSESDRFILEKFSGWGGLSKAFREPDGSIADGWHSIVVELENLFNSREMNSAKNGLIDAFFTPQHIIEAMYKPIIKQGLKPRKILEPSLGTGEFIRYSPFSHSSFYGAELDKTTSNIARYLYPDASIVNKPFQDVFHALAKKEFNNNELSNTGLVGSCDIAIGNPPYSQERVYDVINTPLSRSPNIHSYFLNKALNKLSRGGVASFVISRYFLDSSSQEATALRSSLAREFELVKAIRLPGEAFTESANTDVVTDVIYFQRRENPITQGEADQENWVNSLALNPDDVGKEVRVNAIFQLDTEEKSVVLGSMRVGSGRFGSTLYVDRTDGWEDELSKECSNVTFPHPLFDTYINDLINEVNIENKSDFPIYDGDAEEGSIFIIKQGDKETLGLKMNYHQSSWKKAIGYTPIEIALKGEDNKSFFGDNNASYRVSEGSFERLIQYIPLRDAFFNLINLEAESSPEDNEEINRVRETLNYRYNAFIKDFGLMSTKANQSALSHDGHALSLSSRLEYDFDPGVTRSMSKKTGEPYRPASAKRGDILDKRVLFPDEPIIEYASTPQDALALSMTAKGRVDIEFIEHVLRDEDLSWESIHPQLHEYIMIGIENGRLEWVISDDFIGGDMKSKKNDLQEFMDRHNDGSQLLTDSMIEQVQRSLDKIKESLPDEVEFEKIAFTPGAHWLPEWIVKEFLEKTLGTKGFNIYPNIVTGAWDVASSGSGYDRNDEYTTERFKTKQMISAFLNQKQPSVFDLVINSLGVGSRVLNEEETMLARSRFDKLMEYWDQFAYQDPRVVKAITEKFNKDFNFFAERKMSGSYLSFNGSNPDFNFRPTQRHGIHRILKNNDPLLLSHAVGAGKTATVIAAFMEGKRIGKYDKTSKCGTIVPKGLEGQWASSISMLYPGARVLMMSKRDMSSAQARSSFYRRVSSQKDIDFVIITSPQFSLLSRDKEFEMEYLENQLIEYRKALILDDPKIKNRSIQQKMLKLKYRIDRISKDMGDTTVTLKQLGFGMLIQDESDIMRAIGYTNAGSYNGVKGLGNPKGSYRAQDWMIKCAHARSMGIKVVEATGTPEVNSLIEVYLNMVRLSPEKLKSYGVYSLPQFLSVFCKISPESSYSASGEYKEHIVIVGYQNLSLLRNLVQESRDTVSIKTVMRLSQESGEKSFTIPTPKGGSMQTKVSELSLLQKAIIGEQIGFDEDTGAPIFPAYSILSRFSDLANKKGPPKKEEDNVLSLSILARLALADPMLVVKHIDKKYGQGFFESQYGHFDLNETPPQIRDVALHAANSWKEHEIDRGVQLIYCDLGTPKKGGLSKEGMEIQRLLNLIQEYEKNPDDATDKMQAEVDLAEEFLAKYSQEEIYDLTDTGQDASVYEKIRDELIKQGVPEKEIAFIHDYEGEARDVLLGKLRSGEVRICIGSTSKMSAGMNVQDRITGVLFVGAPSVPRSIVQATGRALRQGHLLHEKYGHFEVDIVMFLMQHPIHAWMGEILKIKELLISGVLDPDSNIQDCIQPHEFISPESMIEAASNNEILENRSLAREIIKILGVLVGALLADRNNKEGKLEKYTRLIALHEPKKEILKALRENLDEAQDVLSKARHQFNLSVGDVASKRTKTRENHRAFVNEMRLEISKKINDDWNQRGEKPTKTDISNEISLIYAPQWEAKLNNELQAIDQGFKEGWIPFNDLNGRYPNGQLKLENVGHAVYLAAIELSKSTRDHESKDLFEFKGILISVDLNNDIFGQSICVKARPISDVYDIDVSSKIIINDWSKEINKSHQVGMGISVNSLIRRLGEACATLSSEISVAQNYIDNFKKIDQSSSRLKDAQSMKHYFSQLEKSCLAFMRTGITNWNAAKIIYENIRLSSDIEEFNELINKIPIDDNIKLQIDRVSSSKVYFDILSEALGTDESGVVKHWFHHRKKISTDIKDKEIFDPWLRYELNSMDAAVNANAGESASLDP